MEKPLPKPCNECPFRRKSPAGYIGGHDDIIEIHNTLEMDMKFPCHTRTNQIKADIDNDDQVDNREVDTFEQACEEAPPCTGSLIYMANKAQRPHDHQMAKWRDKLGKSPGVFANSAELLEHHKTKDPRGLQIIQMMKEHVKRMGKRGGK